MLAALKSPRLASEEESEQGKVKKRKKKKEEDLAHLVAATACAWEIVLRMNSGGEETGPNAISGGGGRGPKECYLPRVIPPLLYPLQTQIASWLEHLKEACVVVANDKSGGGSSVEAGDNSTDGSMHPQVVQSLSWLEFIVTLNTCKLTTKRNQNAWLYHEFDRFYLSFFYIDSPNENLQITRSVVTSFWLPSNDPLPGIGGGLPLNNGSFTLPYGLRGAGRLHPLSHRLIRKMSIHLQMMLV